MDFLILLDLTVPLIFTVLYWILLAPITRIWRHGNNVEVETYSAQLIFFFGFTFFGEGRAHFVGTGFFYQRFRYVKYTYARRRS